jgi:cardiolipin synthase
MTIANWITVGRVFLVPFFVISLSYYRQGEDVYRFIAFWIFISASLTDALDGFIARKWDQKSNLGSFIDPLADKLLVICGFLTIHFSPEFVLKPPVWIIIVIVSRDIVIIAGLLLIYITTGKVNIQPNLLGKTTTLFQMTTLASILLILPFSPILWYITVLLTILSCIVYVIREGKRLNGNHKQSQEQTTLNTKP